MGITEIDAAVDILCNITLQLQRTSQDIKNARDLDIILQCTVYAYAGTFAVISLMIGGVAVREAPDSMFYELSTNGSNASAVLDVAARDARRVQVAVVLTTLVGIIQVRLDSHSQHVTLPLVYSLCLQHTQRGCLV